MSEYQYFEFQAVDRPLTTAEQQLLRNLSTRARITATSFVNSYEWGSFKGNPARLMESCFDLHLYLANWGSRRFCLRLPKKLVDRPSLEVFLREADIAELRGSGADIIVEIARDELEFEDFDDGSGWLAALAPLRADILSGDLRMFYLLWLTAVEADVFEPDEPEPLPGLGPLNARLKAFAEFFQIDADLVAAAAKKLADPVADGLVPGAVAAAIGALPESKKAGLLLRLYNGDAHVSAELRKRLREDIAKGAATTPIVARTVGKLRALAASIERERKCAADAAAAAERERREREKAEARQRRLDALAKRGEHAWREVEGEIERRNAVSYDRAAELLVDLRDVANAQGAMDDFARRLATIRRRHAKKKRFLERLRSHGLGKDSGE